MDGLTLAVAIPEDDEDRKTPQRPGHAVQQQVAFAEGQCRPDDGVGYPGIPQNLLRPPCRADAAQSRRPIVLTNPPSGW